MRGSNACWGARLSEQSPSLPEVPNVTPEWGGGLRRPPRGCASQLAPPVLQHPARGKPRWLLLMTRAATWASNGHGVLLILMML